jgi:hypothetical protein
MNFNVIYVMSELNTRASKCYNIANFFYKISEFILVKYAKNRLKHLGSHPLLKY